MCSKTLQSDDRLLCDIEISGKTQTYCLKSVCNFKVTRFYLILLCKQHNWTSGTYSIEIILGCVFLGQKLSGRRFLSLPVSIFCSLSRASRASHTWLKIDRNDFYACCLRRYLHGRQSCFPSSEKRCTLFRRSSGPLENLLLQQNGENMLLQGLCVNNYNHKCEVLQIKTMTEGYDDRFPQYSTFNLSG